MIHTLVIILSFIVYTDSVVLLSLCPEDSYKGAVGECLRCPANSSAPAGSNAITSCSCNTGSRGLDGGTCSPCEAGKYSDKVGQSVCTECPTNSMSAAGSSVISDCICNPGASGANGESCALCIAGTYKTLPGLFDPALTASVTTSDECQQFTPNSTRAKFGDIQVGYKKTDIDSWMDPYHRPWIESPLECIWIIKPDLNSIVNMELTYNSLLLTNHESRADEIYIYSCVDEQACHFNHDYNGWKPLALVYDDDVARYMYNAKKNSYNGWVLDPNIEPLTWDSNMGIIVIRLRTFRKGERAFNIKWTLSDIPFYTTSTTPVPTTSSSTSPPTTSSTTPQPTTSSTTTPALTTSSSTPPPTTSSTTPQHTTSSTTPPLTTSTTTPAPTTTSSTTPVVGTPAPDPCINYTDVRLAPITSRIDLPADTGPVHYSRDGLSFWFCAAGEIRKWEIVPGSLDVHTILNDSSIEAGQRLVISSTGVIYTANSNGIVSFTHTDTGYEKFILSSLAYGILKGVEFLVFVDHERSLIVSANYGRTLHIMNLISFYCPIRYTSVHADSDSGGGLHGLTGAPDGSFVVFFDRETLRKYDVYTYKTTIINMPDQDNRNWYGLSGMAVSGNGAYLFVGASTNQKAALIAFYVPSMTHVWSIFTTSQEYRVRRVDHIACSYGAPGTCVIQNTVADTVLSIDGPCMVLNPTLPTPEVCGDGLRTDNEECDVGSYGDDVVTGCSWSCQVIWGFTCSHSKLDVSGACVTECGDTFESCFANCVNDTVPYQSNCYSTCGDGRNTRNEGNEECDDGNTVSLDGCDSQCKIEIGWYCGYGGGEPCWTHCGDAVLAGLEECDDGNLLSGDGCDKMCRNETLSVELADVLCYGDCVCSNATGVRTGTFAIIYETTSEKTCTWLVSSRATIYFEFTGLSIPQTASITVNECSDSNCRNPKTRTLKWGDKYPSDGSSSGGYLQVIHKGSSTWASPYVKVKARFYLSDIKNKPPNLLPSTCADTSIVDGLYADAGCEQYGVDKNYNWNAFCLEDNSGFGTCLRCPCACTEACITCGDGRREGNETCDDGNTKGGDGCNGICYTEAGWNCTGEPTLTSNCGEICGDGLIVGREACDDGNVDNGDGCDNVCEAEDGWNCSAACEPICGDGLRLGSEACDDGNLLPDDGCDGACAVEQGWDCDVECTPICGDGLRLGSEACDDGNMDTGDGCDALCVVEDGWECSLVCEAICGDGRRLGSEVCDDGQNTAPGGGCSATCTANCGYTCDASGCVATQCGDGIVAGVETCDDGNSVAGDGCLDCVEEVGYACNHTVCGASKCFWMVGNEACGDGTTLGAEIHMLGFCDDGNRLSSDGCSSTCTVECGFACAGGSADTADVCNSTCGNGVKTDTKNCDDGNADAGDGCSDACQVETGYICNVAEACGPSICDSVCGDGFIIQRTENCDDGNTESGDGCSSTCSIECGYTCDAQCVTTCGDGVYTGTEQCDDGNTVAGDGCSDSCLIELGYACAATQACGGSTCGAVCGDQIIKAEEVCDDGNTYSGDGCSSTCSVECGYTCDNECLTECGDGVLAGSEECDDGNLISGDRCDSSCKIEPDSQCTTNTCANNTCTCNDDINFIGHYGMDCNHYRHRRNSLCMVDNAQYNTCTKCNCTCGEKCTEIIPTDTPCRLEMQKFVTEITDGGKWRHPCPELAGQGFCLLALFTEDPCDVCPCNCRDACNPPNTTAITATPPPVVPAKVTADEWYSGSRTNIGTGLNECGGGASNTVYQGEISTGQIQPYFNCFWTFDANTPIEIKFTVKDATTKRNHPDYVLLRVFVSTNRTDDRFCPPNYLCAFGLCELCTTYRDVTNSVAVGSTFSSDSGAIHLMVQTISEASVEGVSFTWTQSTTTSLDTIISDRPPLEQFCGYDGIIADTNTWGDSYTGKTCASEFLNSNQKWCRDANVCSECECACSCECEATNCGRARRRTLLQNNADVSVYEGPVSNNAVVSAYQGPVNNTLEAVCERCPPGRVSSAGSTFCFIQCAAGEAYSRGEDRCEPCPEATFKNATGPQACARCPGNHTSTLGSQTPADCTCAAGYTVSGDGRCVECVAGTYKDGPGSDVCRVCPLYSNAPAGSQAGTACACIAGYIGPAGGPCTVCVAGTYQSATDACSQCTAGKYSASDGRNGSDACLSCPTGTDSVAGSLVCGCKGGWDSHTGPDGGPCTKCSDWSHSNGIGDAPCVCSAGYPGPDNGVCVACTIGKYQAGRGDLACVSCPAGHEALAAGATVCTKCPLQSFKAHDGDGLCRACPRGKWADIAGATECTCDPDGKMRAGPGAPPSRTCDCPPGTNGPPGWCLTCKAGQYGLGRENPCTDCPVPNCTSDNCVNASFSPEGSTSPHDCQCPAGSTGPMGAETCILCRHGEFHKEAGHTLTVHAQCNETLADYLTRYAYSGLSNGKPFYKSHGNTTKYIYYFEQWWYVGDALDQKTAIGLKIESIADDVDIPRTNWSEWCSSMGWLVGKPQTAGEANILDAGCETCRANSESIERQGYRQGSTECSCGSGFYSDTLESECVPCVAGKYRDRSEGTVPCSDCAAGKYSTVTEIGCTDCPVPECTPDNCVGASFSPEGSTGPHDCQCPAGSTGPMGAETCIICRLGKFHKESTHTLTVHAQCKETVADYLTRYAYSGLSNGKPFYKSQGATTKYIYYFEQWWYVGDALDQKTAIGLKIESIADDFDIPRTGWSEWCSSLGWLVGKPQTAGEANILDAGCETCRANSESIQGQGYGQGSTGCTCGNGFYSDTPESECVQCAAGKYRRMSQGNVPCSICAAGKYSAEIGATSEWICADCDMGKYQPLPGKSSCIDCLAGKYLDLKGSVAATDCKQCPTSAGAGRTGSVALSDCICEMGSADPNGSPFVLDPMPIIMWDIKCEFFYDQECLQNKITSYPAETSAKYRLQQGVIDGQAQELVQKKMVEGIDGLPVPRGVEFTHSLKFLHYPSFVYSPLNLLDVWNAGDEPGITFSLWTKMATITNEDARIMHVGVQHVTVAHPNQDTVTDSDSLRIRRYQLGHGLVFESSDGGVNPRRSVLYRRTKYNVWHHIVWSIDGAGHWHITVDDIEVCDISNPCPSTQLRAAKFGMSQIMLGGSGRIDMKFGQPYGNFAWGRIADFRVYDRVVRREHMYDFRPPVCVACDNGKYQDKTDASTCLSCPQYTFTQHSGSADITHCLECPTGTVFGGVPGSGRAACICAPGFTAGATHSVDFVCEMCVAGKYKTTTGTSQCLPCPAGTYGQNNECVGCPRGTWSDTVAVASCRACTGGRVSRIGTQHLSDCYIECPRGDTYSIPDEVCVSCKAGKAKPSIGPEACTECIGPTTTVVGDTTECGCKPGYTTQTGSGSPQGEPTCVKCATSTYKPAVGPGACTNCPYGVSSTRGNIALASCVCIPGASSVNGTCVCMPGYTAQAGRGSLDPTCVKCATGTYKPAGGSEACTKCPVYSATRTEGSISSTDCMCAAGASPGNTGCIPCVGNRYKSEIGMSACIPCQQFSLPVPSKVMCACRPGILKRPDGSCSSPLEETVVATVVKMVIGLPLTEAEFTAEKQTAFTNAIAATAGVENELVEITDIQPTALRRRRRMLSAGLSVSTQITAQNMTNANSIADTMTPSNINTQMQSVGIPEVAVSTSASIAVVYELKKTPEALVVADNDKAWTPSGGAKNTHRPPSWVYAAVLCTACMFAIK